MNTASSLILVTILTLLPPVSLTAAQAQSGDPSTSPAEGLTTTPSVSRPVRQSETRVSDEARIELDLVRNAYLALETLEVTGTLTTDSEVAGRVEKSQKPFSGTYLGPAHFRHEVEGELITGSTGSQIYIFNVKHNEYLMSEMDDGTSLGTDNLVSTDILAMLRNQNPSLLLALLREPLQAFGPEITEVERVPDQKTDGKQYTALRLSTTSGRGEMTVLIDKETSLVRRITLDMKPALERSGVAGVRKANYVIEYDRVRRRGPLVKDDFAWTPPAGARRISVQADGNAVPSPATVQSATTSSSPRRPPVSGSADGLPSPTGAQRR